MKPVNQWTENDLLDLIRADVRESLTLDYKRSAALGRNNDQRREMSKDVSAFANSAGGIIVYGMIEKQGRPQNIDDGCDGAVPTREFIEQIINSTIQPRIQGIIIQQIPLGMGHSVYVISVPQATALAPHQASDNKYYRRFNFASVPMADYEVRDTLRRAKTPDLFLVYEWTPFELLTEGLRATLSVSIGNKAPEPAFYTSVDIIFDRKIVVTEESGNWNRCETRATFLGEDQPVTVFHRNLIVPSHQPIFQERLWGIGSFKLIIDRSAMYSVGYLLAFPGFNATNAGMLRAQNGQPVFTSEGDEQSNL